MEFSLRQKKAHGRANQRAFLPTTNVEMTQENTNENCTDK